LEGYCRFVPDKEPEGSSKGKKKTGEVTASNRLKSHERTNIILLIQGLMKYNKHICKKYNNLEWSTSHNSCA
jgi:hypothetical protein